MKRSRISVLTQSLRPLNQPKNENPSEPKLISSLPLQKGEPETEVNPLSEIKPKTIKSQIENETKNNLKDSISDSQDVQEFIQVPQEELSQETHQVYFQNEAIEKLVKIFQSKYFCVILQGPSGHGKSIVIEEARRRAGYKYPFVNDSNIVGDSSSTFKELFSLSLKLEGSLKKCNGVLIDNIEGLDSDIKKNLSLFVKKNANQCRLILTTDSLYESPTKTLKTQSGVSVVNLKTQDTHQIQTIVQNQALSKQNWSVPLDKLLDLSEASNRCPRAAITLFDFVAQTKKANSSTKTKHTTKSFRDTSYDLFSQVPSVARGNPQKYSLQSSDLIFASQVLYENTTKHRDSFSNYDIFSKDFLFDNDTMQYLLESPFKADPNPMQTYGRMTMPKSTKPKLIEQAAWMDRGNPEATEKGLTQALLQIAERPYGIDAYQTLDLIRRRVKESNFKGRWTSKMYGYDTSEDIRNLRNPDKPIFVK